MANPSFSVFLYLAVSALVFFFSVDAREMSSFAKFSQSSLTASNDNDTDDMYQRFATDKEESDTYKTSGEDEPGRTPYGKGSSPQFQQFDQFKEEEKQKDGFTTWNQKRSEPSQDGSQYNQHSYTDGYTPSGGKSNFYNSNPFEEEDGRAKRGSTHIPNRHSETAGGKVTYGMSDTRHVANGKYYYDVNNEGGRGASYKSKAGETREVTGERDEEPQYYNNYEKNREGSLNDPERLSAYDP